ncbi:N-acetylneuraminate synthase family protein [Geobacter sp. DSM 9736]|uniref:N-acetylneuraminate synthase family protein n=1 Tax=Geobacter sp. DSM 9736 TaxID=1277350 RepID=UPI000B4FFA48|nr:N-acetylneuraminate synthase family protein [Geobacter sp. DSM 9736]SNB45041.1 N-acetylneuraminate synthase [Geobacter sp. DSM 9736]
MTSNSFYQKVLTGKYPYVIAEIGSNHNGDIALAKEMIRSAAGCGCDAVKFQSWTPSSLICQAEYDCNQSYDDSPKKHFGSLRDMVERYYLREEQHFELKEFCDQIGVDFCSSPFAPEEVDLLCRIDVPFIKVASMDINNDALLRHIAGKGKPVVLSTGMASMAEIDNAIKTIETTGNNEIVLLHCISIYPPVNDDINLRNIVMLQQSFGYPVGFSDHSLGVSIPLASVVLGAKVIEKHFTTDKDLPGWDHEISADPGEMKSIVVESHKICDALGSYKRIVSGAEEQKKSKFRRSIVLKKNLVAGEVIGHEDLDFKRPGTGIHPDEVRYVVGRKVNRSINADELLKWNDLL